MRVEEQWSSVNERESALTWLINHLLSYVSYRLCFTCLVLVPLTHLLTVLLFSWLAKGGILTKALLLNGGKRHQAFSLCGWGLWAVSALASLPVWLSGPLSTLPQLKTALFVVPHSHVDVVSGAAAAISFVGELFLVQAMLVYEPPGLRQSKLQALSTSKALPGTRMVLQSMFGVLGKNIFGIARHASAALVVLIGLMLSITGALLLLSVEHMPDVPSRVLYCCLSLVCLIIGASSTHGLGGYLQWGKRPVRGGPPGLSRSSTLKQRPSGLDRGDSVGRDGEAAHKPLPSVEMEPSSPVPAPDEGDLCMGSPKGSGEMKMTFLLQAPEPHSCTGDANHQRNSGLFSHLSCSNTQSRQSSKSSIPTINRKDSSAALEVTDDQQGGADWHFYQPFAGGTVFVGTQAVGWTLFSLTSCYVVILSKVLVTGMVHTLRSYLLGGSVLMMSTQTILALSLLTWRARRAARGLMQPASRRQSTSSIGAPPSPFAAIPPAASQEVAGKEGTAQAAGKLATPFAAVAKDGEVPLEQQLQEQQQLLQTQQQQQQQQQQQEAEAAGPSPPLHVALQEVARACILRNVPLFIMYLPSHAFFTMWALTFVFFPQHWTAVFWLFFMPAYFAITLRNEPQHTGVRQWRWLCTWLADHADESLSAWFGNVEVILDRQDAVGDKRKSKVASFHPSGRYIFGFHPHGLYPTGAGFLSMLRGFREGLPGLTPITLTASVLFYVPGVRDLSCWLGFRQVSRRTFVRALRDKGSVIVCPGGQAELVYAHCSHRQPGVPKCPTVTQHLSLPQANGTQGSQAQLALPISPTAGESALQGGPASHPGVGGEDAGSKAGSAGSVMVHATVKGGKMGRSEGLAGGEQEGWTSKADAADAHRRDQQQEQQQQQQQQKEDPHEQSDEQQDHHKQLQQQQGYSQQGREQQEQQQQQHEHSLNQQPQVGSPSPGCGGTAGCKSEDSMGGGTQSCMLEGDCASKQGGGHAEDGGVCASKQGGRHAGCAGVCASNQGGVNAGCGRDLVIYAGHKGFVRLAIEQGAALVPVLALGEVLQLRNLISWPSLQRWTYKRLGFPLPYFIGGRWGITPFPAKTPLVYVVGEPIEPPPLQPGVTVPQEAVDSLHARFYAALEHLFEKHKHRHPEFAHGKLRMLLCHQDDL